MNIKILVATHKQYWMPEDSVYMPIHVGREGKSDIGYTGDHTGDNISLKNANYCELTGLYWAWKNLDADYIGLVHYRRYFTRKEVRSVEAKKEQILTSFEWEQLLSEYPVVVADKRKYYIESNRSHYNNAHHSDGLDAAEQIITEKYPEYRTMCTAPDGHIYSFPWIEQLGAGKEAIQAIGDIPYINKKWLDYLGLEVPTTTDELEQVLIAFRDHADELEKEFDIEGGVIPMSFIINNGDQDPAILMNGFGEGYGDTGDHFAVTDEGKVIYTPTQEGYKEGIEWLHKLVTEDLIDPEAFTQEWSTYVAKGKNHRYGLCFTWDIANIDNNTDYVMLPALTGPDGVRNITRQNNSETSGFDRGRCVLTSSCRDTALAAAWIDQMYAPIQSPQNNWGTYGEKDSFNIFEMSTNDEGGQMLKHMDLGDQSPVEVREAQSVNGPLAVLNEYYDVYVTEPADAKWRLDNMHEAYLKDMNSKYVYPNVFMSIDDTNKVSQYDTDIKKYAEQKKADWILNGGIDKEWDSYLKKLDKYGLQDYLKIKQKYFDSYQKSLESTSEGK